MDEKERTPLYRVEEGVAWLTLNRPETLNSFTTEFVHEINDAIRAAEEDDKVRALVVTGEGRGFTSGGNLSELAAMNRDRKRAIYDVDSTADMVRLLYNVKKPVIAAINGPAFGAGIALAMACDILIASDRAQFGFSFTGLGFCPDSGTCWFLTQRVGYNKACEILFSARTLNAEELKELGLVNEVVPHEQLIPAAAKAAGRIAKGPALALMLQKRVLRNAVSTSFEQNRDYEAVSQIFASQTDDCREGLSAALERRAPGIGGYGSELERRLRGKIQKRRRSRIRRKGRRSRRLRRICHGFALSGRGLCRTRAAAARDHPACDDLPVPSQGGTGRSGDGASDV